ncbi:MAG TPA: response regulator [Aggregatilineales bacterium]|nr:response regulator [Anaerolineales bacterium]HRE49430.1 response regulator [Aggregatilineales bacterium]
MAIPPTTILRGKTIFYIEDNPGNRSIVQMILEREGAKIAYDRWGSEDVIAKLKTRLPIDLILCDLMLPNNVTGYDVFHRIREEADLRTIPVAVVSAADPGLEMNRARAEGFVGFITKPIHLIRFPQQIARLLAGETVWDGE